LAASNKESAMSKRNRQVSAFDLQTQMQSAFALHQQGRLTDAEEIYRQVLRSAPDHFGALSLLGTIACQKRDYARAAELLSKAVSINPHVPASHSNLAVALKELGRFEEARASCEKAIALKPDYAEAYYNRGLALKELGRPEEALASYDKALALRPDSEAYYNRGNLLAELKRFDEAITSYSKALALNAAHVDAQLNLGNALKEVGRTEDALASYDRAIAIKPACAEAHHNRAIVLNELGRRDASLASYERAIALEPDQAEVYSDRAKVLKELGRLDEALASCDKAIALKSDFAEAYYNKGIVLREFSELEQARACFEKATLLKEDFSDAHNYMGLTLNELGQAERARDALSRAIEIDPKSAGAYFNLSLSKKFVPDDPDLIAMQRLVSGAEGGSEEATMLLHFALGKAYADLKDHRRSFEHLLAANKAKRATISYDEEAASAAVDAIETTFSRALIDAKSGAGDPSRQPIFILGMPRSGTTLVEQILASHPMVHGAGELETFRKIAQVMYRADGARIAYPSYVPALDGSALKGIGARYLAETSKDIGEHDHVTDKMPSNYALVGLIHLALPNAKIIHTMRDPVDTCVSCFSILFTHGQEFTYDLAELGRYYKRYERLMAHWHRVLPAGRILDVHYEEVVTDLEGQARRIIAHCGLPWDDRCLSFHETERPVRTASFMQVRQPIYKKAVGRWREYEEFLGPLLAALEISASKN